MAATQAVETGISFALTEEQKALRALAHEFAEKEIRPRAAEYDEHQTHPGDVIAKAHEVGLMNLHVPETYGGPELGHFDKMGQRATDTSAISFQDVVVPVENRLGAEGDGFKIAMRTLDSTRPGTAIGAVGVARAAFEYACDYSKERVTFEQPIAMHQGVNFLIADMATKIEAARLLTWQAAWMLDNGWGRKATLYSSMANGFAAG